jgi:hypothetical protein
MERKTSTVPILMHQMRISTTYVFSMMLKPNKMEIRNNVRNVKSLEKNEK